MCVWFFMSDGVLQPIFDRKVVRFNTSQELPAPPKAFLQEHFRQAVLANVRGQGQALGLQFNPSEDSHDMSVFESGGGKEWFERELKGKLISEIDDKVYFKRSPIEAIDSD